MRYSSGAQNSKPSAIRSGAFRMSNPERLTMKITLNGTVEFSSEKTLSTNGNPKPRVDTFEWDVKFENVTLEFELEDLSTPEDLEAILSTLGMPTALAEPIKGALVSQETLRHLFPVSEDGA